MAKLTAIYGLYDPRDGALRYIGKSVTPLERWLQHCRPKSWPAHIAQPVSKWCAELRKLKLRPEMRVFTWCQDWAPAERRLIAAYRNAGADLLNLSPGGYVALVRQTPEQAAISVANRSPLWQSAAVTLGRRAWEMGPPAAPLLKEALWCLKAVRRRIQREGNRADLKRFDLNAHSHIVLGVVRDFPVLPFHPAYDHCWHSRAH